LGLRAGGPAILGIVSVHLLKLVEYLGGSVMEPERFVQAAHRLKRLAETAATPRREYLRQQVPADGQAGFAIDRARFVVQVQDADNAARIVLGCGPGPSPTATKLVKRVETTSN
jgi:hypothetical protein